MKSKTFFVLGCNSFSGSSFIRVLIENNFKVFGLGRSKEPSDIFLPYKWDSNNNIGNNFKNKLFTYYELDLNKSLEEIIKVIDEVRPNYIINFIAQGMVAESWLNPKEWYQTNLLSQVCLHDELRKRTWLEKYVHVSTPEVYGSTDQGWIKENFNFSPSTPYAVSRAACDMHLMSFYKAYKFPVVFTRAANVYGPGQQLYRIIPRTILSAKTGRKMQLHGGGLSERSFIHINDVAEATLTLALNAKPGSSWHISTKKAITIRNLVEFICEIIDVKFDDIVDISTDRLGKDQNYLLNSNLLRDSFNWSDKIDLEKGIIETINWIENNLDTLKNISWDYHHKS